MKDYRVTVKVRNNRILKAIDAVGGTTGLKWCSANGLGYARVNDLVNMTCSPIDSDGKLYRDAERLCDVLNKLPEDLWSNEQLYPLEKNFSEIEMDHAQVVDLLPNGQDSYLPDFSGIEQAETTAILSKVVSTLSQREQDIIRMRFEEDLTLEECGRRMGVTVERIRDIQNKALRNLRKPANVVALLDVIDVSENTRAYYKSLKL